MPQCDVYHVLISVKHFDPLNADMPGLSLSLSLGACFTSPGDPTKLLAPLMQTDSTRGNALLCLELVCRYRDATI